MTRLEYSRFVTQFIIFNDAAYAAAYAYIKYLFKEGLCIDFWYTEDFVNFTVIANKIAYKVKLPSSWLLCSPTELDTKLGLLTHDELWSFIN
jgi:hypothetical protein